MPNSKPLTYDSLRTVLQHMEANKRFQVAQKCPSIRRTEKAVPLSLKYLNFDEHKVCINDTTYTISGYRKYQDGVQVPKLHKEENKVGGSFVDLDKYGAPENFLPRVLSPDDILIDDVERHDHTNEEYIDRYTNKITSILVHRLVTVKLGIFDSEQGDSELGQYLVRLQPYLNKRDNVLPPYEVAVQLATTCDVSETLQFFKKNKKLHDYMRQLLTFMFGGRRQTVQVRSLVFGDDLEILRAPSSLRIRAQAVKASINVGNNFSALDPIIENAPLELLDIVNDIETEDDVSHPLISSAKRLVLWEEYYPLFVSKLPNHTVYLKEVSIENCLDLVRNVLHHWKGNGREIESNFGFELVNVPTNNFLKDQLMPIVAEFEGFRATWQALKLPLNHASEIHVTFHPKVQVKDNSKFGGHLSITVVPI